jgi:SAM-dependent methyltransferase
MNTDTRRDRVRAVFDDWAGTGRDQGLEEGHLPAVRDTFERWDWSETDRFLDVGCGNGYAVRLAAELAPEGQATGIDISEEMIRRARALTEDSARIEYLHTALEDADLEAASFDKVFSMEAIYYLPDVGAGLARIHDLLRPGGSTAILMDFYAENTAVHHWPEKLGVPMTLLGEADYARLAREAGFPEVRTDRFRRPGAGGWAEEEGTLRLWAAR